MRMVDVIARKRDGEALSPQEIAFFVEGYTRGDIPDYQAAALCMALFWRGMTDEETVCLTDCMARSGDRLDLSALGDATVDKHSTGGVGDKTTLIVAPLAASLGCKVPKMSGRGLGHTGGTVDKLEAIPGYRTSLSPEAFIDQVNRVGVAVIGQTGNLAPADKKLYALRDVTATVDSIPLITASIMSKKLAAGARSIVLDVKVGSGAFMQTEQQALALAEAMVRIGKGCGRRMAAVLTDMDAPLGHAIGNALEVAEAVAVLRGEMQGDLAEVCVALAAQMVALARGLAPEQAQLQVRQALADGSAYAKMKEWIAAQGGDPTALERPDGLPAATHRLPVVASGEGYVAGVNARQLGTAAALLGAGRATKEEAIDPAAGIILHKKPGDRVAAGDVLCTLHTNRPQTADAARALCLQAVTLADEPPAPRPLIHTILR